MRGQPSSGVPCGSCHSSPSAHGCLPSLPQGESVGHAPLTADAVSDRFLQSQARRAHRRESSPVRRGGKMPCAHPPLFANWWGRTFLQVLPGSLPLWTVFLNYFFCPFFYRGVFLFLVDKNVCVCLWACYRNEDIPLDFSYTLCALFSRVPVWCVALPRVRADGSHCLPPPGSVCSGGRTPSVIGGDINTW